MIDIGIVFKSEVSRRKITVWMPLKFWKMTARAVFNLLVAGKYVRIKVRHGG